MNRCCAQQKLRLFLLFLLIYRLDGYGQSLKFEAEIGQTNGTVMDSSRSGFSGSGYITGFKEKMDGVNIIITVPSSQQYKLSISYASSHGPQSNRIYVNDDALGSRSFAKSLAFTEIVIGNVFLKAGDNIIRVEKDWNYLDVDWSYFDLDYLLIQEARAAEPVDISQTLVTPDPSREAKRMFAYLIEMSGKKIMSGQQGNDDELKYILEHTGKRPAIRGFDLLNYTPAIDWDDGTTENIIDWFHAQNGIPTVCWHWFSPTGAKTQKSFYRSETDFNFAKALEEDSDDHALLIRDIDAIAGQLKILRDAGVPVLWRPLHEASSPAFWWGAQGAEPYIRLYRLLFNRLVEHHQLNNLIWVWTTYDDPEAFAWYPGPQYVDIISTDIYLDSNKYQLSSTVYDNLSKAYEGKLVALSENDIIPDPDKLSREKAAWSWFCAWNGDFITSGTFNSVHHIKKVYNDDYVITLDELPTFADQPYKKSGKWNRIRRIMSFTIAIFFAFVLIKVALVKFRK